MQKTGGKVMAEAATSSPFDLHGQVALVTGGNGGLGRSIAAALARAGGEEGNKGVEAAQAAIEMAGIAERLARPAGTED